MTKQQLRKHFTTLRQQLTLTEYNAFSQQLLQQFQQMDLTGINCIHLFLPVLERKEPNTLLVRNWLQEQHPYIKRVFPKADFTSYIMQSYADDEHLQLVVNDFGITEPLEGTLINNQLIDLIVVPLLAVDQQGYRAGYGKGFYDRFIARCRPEVHLMGLSFFEPVEKIDDLHEFDVPLHSCIVPDKILYFN